jgi:hypothetical protein
MAVEMIAGGADQVGLRRDLASNPIVDELVCACGGASFQISVSVFGRLRGVRCGGCGDYSVALMGTLPVQRRGRL